MLGENWVASPFNQAIQKTWAAVAHRGSETKKGHVTNMFQTHHDVSQIGHIFTKNK